MRCSDSSRAAGTRPPSRFSAGRSHPDPRRQQAGVRERPAHRAQRDRELREHLLSERRVGHRCVRPVQLLEPGVLLLRPDRRRRQHHRARNRQALRAVPRSRVTATERQPDPVADQRVPEAGAQPGSGHLHRSEARAGWCGAGGSARAAADSVGLYRPGRHPTAPGMGSTSWSAGTVRAGRRWPGDAIACAVPARADPWAARRDIERSSRTATVRGEHVASSDACARGSDRAGTARSTPACRSGGAIMIREVKRLAVAASCLAVALAGCSFQGVNSLPLPGAVGRGPDCRHLPRRGARMSRRWNRIHR